MTKQPSIGNIGAAKTTSTTLNHPSFPNNVNAIYLDKGNPHILMTEITMKTFNTGISDPLDPSGTTTMTQEYHLEPPVTADRLFTRDGNYFQLIKKYSARDQQFVSTMTSCHGSYPFGIRMWYQYVTIHSETHVIYLHPQYCFIPKANNSKGFSAGN